MVVIMFCLFPLWLATASVGIMFIATAWMGFLIGLLNNISIDFVFNFLIFSGVLVLGILKYMTFTVLYLLSARKFRFELSFFLSVC